MARYAVQLCCPYFDCATHMGCSLVRRTQVGLEPDIACPANGTVPAAMTPAGRSERALVAGLRQDECMRVAARALARPSA
jgi:hypothetical protein